jgi:hypothetical protein
MRIFLARYVLAFLSISLSGLALGQTPEPAGSASTTAKKAVEAKAIEIASPPQTKLFTDLTSRYHFAERYTNREDKVAPGVIGQYHVAILETLKDTVESKEAANETQTVQRQTIFSERPAEVTSLGTVNAAIRTYQRFLSRPDDFAKGPGPRPLDNLTVWIKTQVNDNPLLLSLTENRRLSDREYEIVSKQVFVPNITVLLPNHALRVGDTWRVPRKAMQAMLGEPSLKGENLAGKFVELRRDEDGRNTHAILNIVGQVVNEFAETSINARVVFTFPTPAPLPVTENAPKLNDESPVEARGAITEVRMARVATGVMPGTTANPKRYRSSQELVMERRLGIDPKLGLIKLLDAPAATDVNSWLTYIDPKNRFFFHHPQDMLPPDRYQFANRFGINTTLLVKARPEGRDFVRIELFDKEETPESLKEILNNQWNQLKAELVPGTEEWLPDSDWPNMKVYRIEAALKLPSRGTRGSRMHYDAYLIRLTKKASVMVVATTTRDALGSFKRDIESIIKTFRLVTPDAQ